MMEFLVSYEHVTIHSILLSLTNSFLSKLVFIYLFLVFIYLFIDV